MPAARTLAGVRVAITRPAGTGAAFARQVRTLGGSPFLLPGSSLRAAPDAALARAALRAGLQGDIAIFTSPAAVRFAHRLLPLHGAARVVAPGQGTRSALQRAGVADVRAPARQDSEGILALPELRAVAGACVAIIGAPGGRGLLASTLTARGAAVTHVNVYARGPARLDQRHARALLEGAAAPLYVALTSGAALANLVAGLPAAARGIFLAGTAVVSSARLAAAARAAGFKRTLEAPSPGMDALIARIAADLA